MDRRFLHAGYGLFGFGFVCALLANAVAGAFAVDLDPAFFGLGVDAGATTLIHIAFVAALLALLTIVFSAFVEPSNDEET